MFGATPTSCGHRLCTTVVHNVVRYLQSGAQRRSHNPPTPHRHTARLTTSYCAPSLSDLIMFMQNHLVHHLVSTKLHCAPPKCMSVENYIVNLDLHVRCQPQKYYTMRLCPCASPVYVRCQPTLHDHGTKGVPFVHIPYEPPKNEKCQERLLLLLDIGLPCAPWCTTQVTGAQHSPGSLR